MKPNAPARDSLRMLTARLLSGSVLCNGLDVYSGTSCRNSSNHVLDRVLYQRAQDEEHWTDGPIKQPEACADTFAESLKNYTSCDRTPRVPEPKIWLLRDRVLGNLVFNVEADEKVERGNERTHREQGRSVREEGQPYAPVDHLKQAKAKYLREYFSGKIRILRPLHNRMLDEEHDQQYERGDWDTLVEH